MDGTELRDEIVRLEAQVEAQEARIESCRKFIVASQIAIGLGGALMLTIVLGMPRLGSWALIASIAGLLGGIVLWGSNRSTAREAAARRAEAEVRRAELIGLIDPARIN
jgi:hypothetical protein